jgi:hypothetical protein
MTRNERWQVVARGLINQIGGTYRLVQKYGMTDPGINKDETITIASLWEAWYYNERKLACFLLYDAPNTGAWVRIKRDLRQAVARADAAFIAFWESV